MERHENTSSMKSNSTNTSKSTTTSDVRSKGERTDRKKTKKCKGVRTENLDGVILGAIKLNIENKFLSPEEVLDLMVTHRQSGKSVPGGIKENVAFILENQCNLTRKNFGKRACYVDDCRAWSRTGSCKTHHYILTEDKRLDYVDKKDGNYFKFVKGKRVLI